MKIDTALYLNEKWHMHMLIPKWLQTPDVYGESPNAIFLSPSPFPFKDYHIRKPWNQMVNYSHMVILPEFPNGHEHFMEMG